MSSYKLTLTDDDGLVINSWEISTEYDFDLEDLNSYGNFDLYITEAEFKRLGPERLGVEVGSEVVKDVAVSEGW